MTITPQTVVLGAGPSARRREGVSAYSWFPRNVVLNATIATSSTTRVLQAVRVWQRASDDGFLANSLTLRIANSGQLTQDIRDDLSQVRLVRSSDGAEFDFAGGSYSFIEGRDIFYDITERAASLQKSGVWTFASTRPSSYSLAFGPAPAATVANLRLGAATPSAFGYGATVVTESYLGDTKVLG